MEIKSSTSAQPRWGAGRWRGDSSGCAAATGSGARTAPRRTPPEQNYHKASEKTKEHRSTDLTSDISSLSTSFTSTFELLQFKNNSLALRHLNTISVVKAMSSGCWDPFVFIKQSFTVDSKHSNTLINSLANSSTINVWLGWSGIVRIASRKTSNVLVETFISFSLLLTYNMLATI